MLGRQLKSKDLKIKEKGKKGNVSNSAIEQMNTEGNLGEEGCSPGMFRHWSAGQRES